MISFGGLIFWVRSEPTTIPNAPRPKERKPEILALLHHGYRVIGVDLLYQGDFLDGENINDHIKFVGYQEAGLDDPVIWKRNASYFYGYNRPLFSQQVHDILTAVKYLQQTSMTERLYLCGLDETAAPLVAAAGAMCDDGIEKIALDTQGFRFSSTDNFDSPAFVPGAGKYLDLPGLLALNAPHKLWIAGEDGILPEVTARVYEMSGQISRVTSYNGSDDMQHLIDWLIE